MSTSPSSAPSPTISKSEYYSSLPWFRRCLAMLNWRPVVDYELREIERLDEFNSKIDTLLFSSSTSSTPPPLNARRVRDLISLLEEYSGMT